MTNEPDPVRADPTASIDPLCHAVARKMLRMFDRLPSIDVDDLAQAARIRALHAHATYRPPHSYSSWIWRAAHAAILDLYKSASREANRVTNYAARMTHHYPGSPFAVDAPRQLASVDEMKINLPERLSGYPCGRKGHSPAAYAAALAYRYEFGIGWRTLHRKLCADVGLLSLLGFSTVPSLRRLYDSARRLRRWAAAN